MATTVSMPQLGETVTEGTILRWVQQVGDSVSEDDVLVEISTDKVDTEVPSPVAGVILEILVPEGETVAVGTPLVVIGAADEAPAGSERPSVIQVETSEPTPVSEPAESEPEPEPQPVAAEASAAEAPAAEPERTTVSMPQLGETVTEGTILRWVQQVGDSVSEDDVLVEISTDKVDTEVPSPVAGVILEILVPEGETVAVGTPLVVIGSPSATGAAPAAPAGAPEPAVAEPAVTEPEPTPQPEPAPQPVAAGAPAGDGATRFLSPVVRKLAREHGIDVEQVTGTGRSGRVTRNDVLAYIEQQEGGVAPEPAAAPAAPTPEPAAPTPEPAAPEPAAAQPAAAPPPAAPSSAEEAPLPVTPSRRGDEIRELERLRAAIGRNMIKAKQTAAHVWTSVEVDYERVERVRQAHRDQWKADEGFSLTYLPFIARAALDALRAFPVVNSSYYLEDNKAVFHHDINLGVAIDLNQAGLIVTSIRNADDLTMRGIARAIRTLAEKSRGGKLEPDDISGSTFTITNPGPFGSFMSAPIINVPNVAILSTDTVTKRPTVVTTADGQDTIAIRHIGYLGLTWDHRAFDGSTAVLFLRRIKENLETWDWDQQLM